MHPDGPSRDTGVLRRSQVLYKYANLVARISTYYPLRETHGMNVTDRSVYLPVADMLLKVYNLDPPQFCPACTVSCSHAPPPITASQGRSGVEGLPRHQVSTMTGAAISDSETLPSSEIGRAHV